ncbi:hypothetical protein [Campylobacter sp. RM12651]|uniref:hypothetical protein n=1 Tax=Campylobacter sp. RM12651 TaxID=1660079 RepID=UPI001EFBBF75|nr:hypothetical protein [Campylobacter sp. RM12651]ULO04573.1 hypothetical protein AVBRAN_a0091 [Campylobacter sp. RM12651]
MKKILQGVLAIFFLLFILLAFIGLICKACGVTFWFEDYYVHKTIKKQEFYEKSKHFKPKICIEKNINYDFYKQNYEKTYDEIIKITQKLIDETNSLRSKEIEDEITNSIEHNSTLKADFEIRNNTIIKNLAKIKALEKIIRKRLDFCNHNYSQCSGFYLELSSAEGYTWALDEYYSRFSYCD